MNTMVRRKLEMAARVREFSRTHPSADPSYELVLGRLEERLARAEATAARQHEGLAAARAARLRRSELRRVVHSQLLRYLVAVGSVAGKSNAELGEKLKLPQGNAPHRTFLTAVKGLLTTAQGQRQLLVSEGMSATLLEDLARMVGEFETATEAARSGRREHIGARADLELVSAEPLPVREGSGADGGVGSRPARAVRAAARGSRRAGG